MYTQEAIVDYLSVRNLYRAYLTSECVDLYVLFFRLF